MCNQSCWFGHSNSTEARISQVARSPGRAAALTSACHAAAGFWDGTRNPDHRLRAAVEQACLPSGGSFVWFGLFKHDLAKFRGMDAAAQSAVIGRDITQQSAQTVHSGSYQAPSNVFDSRMVAHHPSLYFQML